LTLVQVVNLFIHLELRWHFQ